MNKSKQSGEANLTTPSRAAQVQAMLSIGGRLAVGAKQQKKLVEEKLVEAVGVEPTSENVTGQEPTYLVQFTRRELPRQIRVLRLERTRNANR